MENHGELQSSSSNHAHVTESRSRKKKEAEDIGISADYIAAFVDRFYTHIRSDEVLGPIFAARVSNWPEHLDNMKRFWRSVLYNSGEFSGNPMLKHIRIPGLEAAHFERWLGLFDKTLRELEPHPEATKQVNMRARMIADSLLSGIENHNDGMNTIAASPVAEKTAEFPLQDGFQMPRWIWMVMIASYGIFFSAITAALGHGEALFSIVIAVCYALIFFSGVLIVNRIGGREKPSPLMQRDGELHTSTGPLNAKEVAAQVLVIPVCVACFAIVALFIRLSITP